MFKRTLVGLDGSAASKKAFSAAVQLTLEQGAELRAVSVEERLPHYAAMVDEVEEAKQQANEYFVQVQCAGLEHADLLVLGHSGHTGVWGQFLGTTADKIVRHAPCSVLVVR